MLTVKDLMKEFQVTRRTIANWYAKRIIPEPVKIGGVLRWREEDIEAWLEYLQERRSFRDVGGDPDSPEGPGTPVYSTGIATLDPRAIAASLRERDRRGKSKTLAAGAEPTKTESMPQLPEPAAAKATEAKR